MPTLYEVRELYGGVYTTNFPDGLVVPWKPLSVGDFIKYSHDTLRGFIVVGQLEDEIFSKCVLDKKIISSIKKLKAGTVSIVVNHIWYYSGPTTPEGIEEDLSTSRGLLNLPQTRIIHELVHFIGLAFPYKPEEIYAMDYETLLMRTAQAESKLLQTGVIQESLHFIDLSNQEEVKDPKPPKQKNKVDAKRLWEEANKTPKLRPDPIPDKKEKRISPILESPPKHNIKFDLESKEQDLMLTGHEKADNHIERAKMVKDAQVIYADVIKELEIKKQKGEIPPHPKRPRK